VSEVSNLLLLRIERERALGRLSAFLAARKLERGLSRSELRSTGNAAQLRNSVESSLSEGLITLDEVASLVDEIEENGGQHIFLFDLTDAGRRQLTAQRLSNALPSPPASPTAAFYADLPVTRRTMFFERHGRAGAKQLLTAEYWEQSKEESEAEEDRRTIVYLKKRRRACNCALFDPALGTGEIRIDRVRDAMDHSLALQLFSGFLEPLAGTLDFDDHLVPLPIWDAFGAIVDARGETYMSTDEAYDPDVSLRIASHREKAAGADIRSHAGFVAGGPGYARKVLNVYWRLPWDQAQLVHTILSVARIGDVSVGKVYVAAKVTPRELNHVLDRIRHFTT
jgi:hypothetical protein